jgi:hypothetical protein
MESGKGFYDWPKDKREAFLYWYHIELIRLMKQDMERGDILRAHCTSVCLS